MISFLGLYNGGVRRRHASATRRAGDPRRPDRRAGVGGQRRPAALRQLPVRAVPRHQRPECLPGQMTRGVPPPSRSLLASQPRAAGPSAPPPPARRRSRRKTSSRPEPTPAEESLIQGRRRPGRRSSTTCPDAVNQDNPGAIRAPPPEAFPTDQYPGPRPLAADRDARPGQRALVRSLHQNTLKGDRPICIRPTKSEARRTRAGCRSAGRPLPGLTGTTGSSSSARSPTR